jgi:hypothetical protein
MQTVFIIQCLGWGDMARRCNNHLRYRVIQGLGLTFGKTYAILDT